jgi:2',3'-cyclic-nucleotide 2'-phosphodiesterase/3'-nucleotidase/5'-nucleotidase
MKTHLRLKRSQRKNVSLWRNILTMAFLFLGVVTLQAQVVINEIDADQTDTDTDEFIELYGTPNASLDGLVVVFFNGSDDQSYLAIDLDGQSLDGNGLFVLGTSTVPNVDLAFEGADNQIQNGADAVAVYTGNAVDFPNDTPISTTNLIDVIVYGTADGDDSGLLSGFGETVQYDEDSNGAKDTESISRVTDGSETFVVKNPTPGALNASTVSTVTRTLEFIASEDANTVEEKLAGGAMDVSSSDLELGSENSTGIDDQRVGIRFSEIIIPPNATINSAYVQFTVDETNKNLDPCVQTIYVEDVENSMIFTSDASNLTSRNTSATTISWTVPEGSWSTVGDAGENERTVDISSLVNIVVSKDGYAIGNALSFFFEGTGRREAESAGSGAPKLVVNVTAPEDAFISVGKDIETFAFAAANNTQLDADINGLISGNEIYAFVQQGTDRSELNATLTLSADAIISPMNVTDFRAPVTYTVTAEDGQSQTFVVTVLEQQYSNDFSADPFAATPAWEQFSVSGEQIWEHSEQFTNVAMSAFGDGCNENEDWMISPVLDMDVLSNEVFLITIAEGFVGGSNLDFVYSNDYTAGTDPSTATWTSLDLIESGSVSGGNDGELLKYNVPSEITGNTNIAFKFAYSASDAGCSTWRINDIVLGGETAETLTLQLLHYADADGNEETALNAVDEFSALVNAFQTNENLIANTLTVHSGDIIIPGPRFYAAEQSAVRDVTGSNEPGHVDVAFANAMGVQAGTIGNHELDAGPAEFFDAAFSLNEVASDFPWLSANIDFSKDGSFSSVIANDGEDVSTLRGKVAKSAVAIVGGQKIGIVGAATPTLPTITSTGDLIVLPSVEFTIDELAGEIQPAVDALKAQGINKIILLAHMQQISVEKGLAEILDGVDIIVAGGSNTRMGNSNNTLFEGDNAFAEAYPFSTTSASNEPVLVVNVDGDYKYLGRLVVDFSDKGVIDLNSIDETESGAYASTADNVAALGGIPNPTVVAIRDAVNGVISEQFGNVVGYTNVYLDGRRAQVRTEETNLGSLSADANLWYANLLNPDDKSVDISLKNGGGIRTEIGSAVLPGGSTDPKDIVFSPPTGNTLSEGNLRAVFRFDNGLSRISLTAAELKEVIEHGVAETALGATPGRFPQVGGMKFTYDPLRNPGDRVRSLIVTGADGAGNDTVVTNGALVGDETRTYNMVTLDFLAGGGDGYPFASLSAPARLDYKDAGDATKDPGNNSVFSATGSEQDAMAEYMATFHDTAEKAFNIAETPANEDEKISRVSTFFTVDEDAPTFEDVFTPTLAGSFKVPGDVFDESAAEIVVYDAQRAQAFFTDANSNVIHVLDMSNPATPALVTSITLTGGPNSVAVYGDLVAVAVEDDVKTDPGRVEFFSAVDFAKLGEVTVGALPDMITFNEDGTKVLTANEGEPSNDYLTDPEGSISVVTIDASNYSASTVATADFKTVTIPAGVRIFGRSSIGEGDAADGTTTTAAQDMEPEYITVSGNTAYVTCQENNALAIVDIETATVTSVIALGTADHSMAGNGIDASDRDDMIRIAQWPVKGFYMPDAITSFTSGEKTYLITANEGDAREYEYENTDGDDVLAFAEESDFGDLNLDPTAFPDAELLQKNEFMGRLTVTTMDGDTDGDGDFDEVYSFGTRSFTIWDAATGTVVWDSKNALEQIVKQRFPDNFNSTNDENNFDNRSDNKGPEPEAVTIGEVNGVLHAFVGLERVGGIVAYDITDPTAPVFAFYVNNRDFSKNEDELGMGEGGDLGPEGLAFVSADKSPTRKAMLIVSNEVSGSVTTYEMGDVLPAPTVELSADVNTATEADATVVTLTATALSPVGIDETLDVTVTGVDAADYMLSASTITILAGETTGFVTFTVVDDTQVEMIETATVTIANPSTGLALGTTISQAITVVNNDFPSAELLISATTMEEGAMVTVTLSASEAVIGDQSVTVALSSTTDASLSGSTLTIADGQTSGTVTITAIDDTEVEEIETFDVTVSSPSSGLVLGVAVSATITITDNDVLGIDNLLGRDLVIYPNPVASIVTISHPTMDIQQVKIYDLSGQLTDVRPVFNGNVELTTLPKGVYMIEIIDAVTGNSVFKRLAKQ